MSIGKRIEDLRESKGISLKDLEIKLGIDKDEINLIEKGERVLADYEIIKIAQIFDVSTDYLLYGEKDKELSSEKITVVDAAKLLNMPAGFLRAGLRSGRIPIGWAIQHNSHKSARWTYYINPKKLKEYIE